MSEVFTLRQGTRPLLISLPHVGFEIPVDQHPRYIDKALTSADTDWHLERLYRPIAERLGASLLVPRFSRYLIDLNRPDNDAPMYPGASNTELCPTRDFEGQPLYRPGQEPDAAERQRRLDTYWRPYHQALRGELDRLKAAHGVALLWDGHSIESELPWLFEGRLPDLNLGSANGASCGAALRSAVAAVLEGQTRYTQVVDGRFKGGHITRHYGQPEQGVHALQMEMVQAIYMLEDKAHVAPRPYLEDRAAELAPVLETMLSAYLGAAR
ncbi:N-formylglutamate deformylase [Inhella gelatinilytica]|uniref:N-formylglutamate deformylase n=1 Tax=Inhella gelatinilytica TaxID=2795030 RepID=A0A931ITP9_9BURK|nr:N-formylglutamate deformylase [Inhella gelatinilytica]MBH9552550.1 N-formylglutamate deformylase [Inhella gelatinilytica]